MKIVPARHVDRHYDFVAFMRGAIFFGHRMINRNGSAASTLRQVRNGATATVLKQPRRGTARNCQ
jgi:hypothetical protein